MKFVSLKTRGQHQQNRADKPASVTVEDFNSATVASHNIHTYTELREQIHHDLRVQHPDWIEPGGQSPMCDFYEARLMELLGTTAPGLT